MLCPQFWYVPFIYGHVSMESGVMHHWVGTPYFHTPPKVFKKL